MLKGVTVYNQSIPPSAHRSIKKGPRLPNHRPEEIEATPQPERWAAVKAPQE
jgi:hypothetical protein